MGKGRLLCPMALLELYRLAGQILFPAGARVVPASAREHDFMGFFYIVSPRGRGDAVTHQGFAVQIRNYKVSLGNYIHANNCTGLIRYLGAFAHQDARNTNLVR